LAVPKSVRGSASMPRMFGDESVDGALERIDEWERSISRRAEQAQTLALRTSGMSATARSRDGLVEVTVGAEGQLSQLHLDERTRKQSAAVTARAIMDTLQAAKDDLIRQFEMATAETVGADSETGRMLTESLRRRLGSPAESSGER
jgi:DNA-binding protein YbaB